MREAIKVEKSILRFRLAQVRNWALMRLKHQREQSLKIYQKLDDWIQVSSKAENDAIDEVCDVIKEAIEEQCKIQDELRLDFMDFFADKGILNYIEPPPEKLAAMEEGSDKKFNVPQLESLVQELGMLADADGLILNRNAVELLSRKAANSKSLCDVGGLPKEWGTFTRNDFETILRNLDIYNTGSIDHKVLATCCILLKSSLPTDIQLEKLKKSLQQPEVTGECFVSMGECWFAEEEASNDRDNSHPYPRAEKIKNILFDLFKIGGTAHVANLCTVLRQKDISTLRPSVKTYSDILTHEIQK